MKTESPFGKLAGPEAPEVEIKRTKSQEGVEGETVKKTKGKKEAAGTKEVKKPKGRKKIGKASGQEGPAAASEEAPEAQAEASKEAGPGELKRAYSKEEWLEAVETLKEQAKNESKKNKIEEKEEIIELTEGMVVKDAEKPETPEDRKSSLNKQAFLYKMLRGGRKEIAESEEEWEKLKAKGMPSYEKSQKNRLANEAYRDCQKELIGHLLQKAEKRWGRDSEKFVNFKNQLIFKGFFGREQERLLQAKEDALPKKEKGLFRKFYEKTLVRYAKLPKAVRWGITAGLGTAVAFGTGGVAAPALLGYAGFRYGRAALGSLSAAAAKALGDGAEKIWLRKHGKEAREEKIRSAIEKESRPLSDLEVLSDYLMVKKDRRNEELAKLVRRQKQWRVGKMAAAIGAGAGVAFWAGSLDHFTHEPQIAGGVKDQMEIKGGSIFKEPEAVPMGPRASEAIPPVIKAENFIEAAKPGDSAWRLAERQLEAQGYFKGLSGTAEEIAAKKTYLTDWAKDQIVQNPGKFGLTDPDRLAVGQKIDFTEIFKDKGAVLKAVGDSENLSPAQLDHINYDNELISQWVKAHPGESLTSDKVADILGGKRLEILNEKGGVTAEDYLRGLAQEEREVVDAGWEDYSRLPGLSEDELRGMEDYYNAKDAVREFYAGQLRTYDGIMEILAPSKLNPAEYLAIKNVTIGKFLEETAGGWEKWRSDEAMTIDLPHDGIYGASEYGSQLKLAEFIRSVQPTEAGKALTIEEFLKKFVKQ